MIHPSYFELMDQVNRDVPEGEAPIVTSRYSIVLGTAKRARQLVAANFATNSQDERKPLSVAVEELRGGKIHILRSEEKEEENSEDEQ